MKIENLEELAEVVEFAKAAKLSRIKIGDIEVELSTLALIEDPLSNLTQKLPEEDAQLKPSNEDDLLFWSTR